MVVGIGACRVEVLMGVHVETMLSRGGWMLRR